MIKFSDYISERKIEIFNGSFDGVEGVIKKFKQVKIFPQEEFIYHLGNVRYDHFKENECFVNAFKICDAVPNSSYVIGLWVVDGTNAAHAWNIIDKKNVDLTPGEGFNKMEEVDGKYYAAKVFSNTEAKHQMKEYNKNPEKWVESFFK